MTTPVSGSLHRGSGARVAALDEAGNLLAEATAAADGTWKLETDAHAEWIIVVLSESAIAAAAVRPSDAANLRLPPLVELQLEFPDAPRGAVLWIDPVTLDGVPPELVSALSLRPGPVIELHLATLSTAAPQRIALQRGTYRTSGRTFALGVDFGETFVLDRIVDEESGVVLPATNGEVVVTMAKDARFRAHFVKG